MPKAPDFLVFVTDQHRPDHTGFGGSGLVQTPHLDALAARSVRFDRAIVANPICMPNRSSILTGRLPSIHGTRYNGIALDRGANTFVRVLRGAGYRTGYFGKAHLQNIGDARGVRDAVFRDAPEQDAGFDPHPEGWDAYEYEERHRREYVEVPPDFYGFDQVDLTVNHSDYCSGHYYQWLLEQGVDPTQLQGRERALDHDAKSPQVYRTSLPEELYPTRYVTQRTVEFLEERSSDDAPFVAFCSYPDPHHPFTPPGRYFDLYDPAKVPLPDTFGDGHADSMPHFRRMLDRRGKQGFIMAPFAPTEEQFREMAAAEFGMIAMIDEGVGQVLAALERSGRAQNTVVVFTSDHGDMFGDHGVMLKAGMHYEGCVRVPLLISAPGVAPGVCTSLASSLDLAQTVLDLADAPEYTGMQGTSLTPLLHKPDDASVRDHVLIEEDQMFDMIGNGRPLRMRTLITEQARLTLYAGSDHGELFDLQADPHEMSNLFARSEAKALRADMTEKLARRQMDYADESPKPTDMA